MQVKKQQLELDMEQQTGPNQERSTSRWYIVTLLIAKCQLDEAHAGIKIAGRNIDNLRYADDTTVMAETEEDTNKQLSNTSRAPYNSSQSCHYLPRDIIRFHRLKTQSYKTMILLPQH